MTDSISPAITLDSRVCVSERQLTSEMGDESVILSLSDGMYYGLDSIGTRIWGLLDRPRQVREICEEIESAYDVNSAQCHEAVFCLLRDLADRGLIELEP